MDMLGQKINGIKAKKLIDKGNTLLIDVRDPVAFRDGSLPDAINLSLRSVSSLMKHSRTTKLIFFGSPNDDSDVRAAINYAIQMGFSQVFSLGTKENWNK